jgi:hypothetical protein
MNGPSDETLKKMLEFFMKTSIPRILEEKRKKEKEERNHSQIAEIKKEEVP